jgi:hypothetical protein
MAKMKCLVLGSLEIAKGESGEEVKNGTKKYGF